MTAPNEYERVLAAEEAIRAHFGLPVGADAAGIGIALGSGLGGVADTVAGRGALPYTGIPHFPRHQLAGHEGELVLGRLAGVPVVILSGRFHYYQCGSAAAAAFPVRVLARMGVRQLIVTNAAGAIRRDFSPGEIVMIRDHINLIPNPLVGAHDDRLGPRFPDMSAAYSPRLRMLARAAAERAGLRVSEGVYAAVTGPSYETPAEIRALALLGADLVGMSTAPEVVVARQAGLEVLGISLVTNMAAGILATPINHAEVMATGAAAVESLAAWFNALLPAIAAASRLEPQ